LKPSGERFAFLKIGPYLFPSVKDGPITKSEACCPILGLKPQGKKKKEKGRETGKNREQSGGHSAGLLCNGNP
jgi:hypothetical protein